MINIAEKLKGCPKGTKLYSPLFGEVELVKIDMENPNFPIVLDDVSPYSNITFTAEGKWYSVEQSECLLFPSKENRDWNKFDYRIKPEPKYRPFANAQECLEEMQKHQPFGWIKCKGCCFNIVYVNNEYVGLADPYYSSISLSSKNSYIDNTFLDGTPFGINIEEE